MFTRFSPFHRIIAKFIPGGTAPLTLFDDLILFFTGWSGCVGLLTLAATVQLALTAHGSAHAAGMQDFFVETGVPLLTLGLTGVGWTTFMILLAHKRP
jgi:hypothetical protein